MAIVPLFKNRYGSVNVVRKGVTFPFNSGRYWTTNKEHIKLLQELADKGEQGIYIDNSEPEIDTEAASPMEVLRRQIIKEWQKQQQQIQQHGIVEAPKTVGASSTADSVLMGNSLASMVENARQAGEDLKSATPETPAQPQGQNQSAALEKLNKLKGN